MPPSMSTASAFSDHPLASHLLDSRPEQAGSCSGLSFFSNLSCSGLVFWVSRKNVSDSATLFHFCNTALRQTLQSHYQAVVERALSS